MISPEIFIECVAQNASERLSDIVLVELLDIHHRGVILSAEPLAALSTLTPSSSVATRHSASKLASALAAPSVRYADVATVATGVSQARLRLRLDRGRCVEAVDAFWFHGDLHWWDQKTGAGEADDAFPPFMVIAEMKIPIIGYCRGCHSPVLLRQNNYKNALEWDF